MMFLASAVSLAAQQASSPDTRGAYFAIKKYEPQASLPTFATLKDRLPSPVFDENPEFVHVYWKTWEIACRNFKEPRSGSGLVSQYVDAAFNGNIFLWDTCFMTMFYNVAHPLTPGIGSLDNFYARQHDDGEICREIIARDGKDEWVAEDTKNLIARWGFDPHHKHLRIIPYIGRAAPQPAAEVSLDGLDNPLPAWAEMESFHVTGDRARLALVYPPLVKYYEAFRRFVRQGNGLYLTCWSSMDNSPRNEFLKGGGCGVETSAQMVLFARELAEMARLLGLPPDEARFNGDAAATAAIINKLMWDPEKKFYYDVDGSNHRIPVMTVAGFWPMLAGVANKDQAAALVAELNNPATFKRVNRIPTLAADQKGYEHGGNYWRGSVWAPTNTMVIRGLEKYGYNELARDIALGQLTNVCAVFDKTHTIWENYAPDSVAPGSDSRSRSLIATRSCFMLSRWRRVTVSFSSSPFSPSVSKSTVMPNGVPISSCGGSGGRWRRIRRRSVIMCGAAGGDFARLGDQLGLFLSSGKMPGLSPARCADETAGRCASRSLPLSSSVTVSSS
jgi:hypothetical protein